MDGINVVELTIVVILFLVVTVLGFVASRWRRGESLMHLDEWGLGGRSFGSWITWFLLGGDLYTAYTFVAVPALMVCAEDDPALPARLADGMEKYVPDLNQTNTW